jgi:quinol-cytochrome oxidoreductase complex cytochrome b subunit
VAEYAYADMKYLEFDMPFGMLMRNMHRWAAHAMIVFVWLHMFRVFLTGSYKPPREFNWVVGVILLLLTSFGASPPEPEKMESSRVNS